MVETKDIGQKYSLQIFLDEANVSLKFPKLVNEKRKANRL